MKERPMGKMVKPRDTAGRPSVTSTEAQNNFGAVLTRAFREGRVFITRYHRPEAVLMSMDAYESLVGEEPVDLDALEREFDERVSRMQTREHGAGVDALFAMTSEELGRAAVDAADAADDDD